MWVKLISNERESYQKRQEGKKLNQEQNTKVEKECEPACPGL